MTSPQPDPARPGIDVSVEPGDTPPAADSMSGAAGDNRRGDQPNMGPISGNRTPMIVTLVILGILVLAVMGVVLASIVSR